MTNVPPDDEFPQPESGEPQPRIPVALAATEDPVQLDVQLVEDERTPDGMVCMGTFREGRLIARCVLPPEAWQELSDNEIFEEAVPVVLVAQEAPPGLQCRLYAMIVVPTEEEEDDEPPAPWAASVPSSGYEAAVAENDDDSEESPDVRMVPLPLGNIVRFERDRVHPDSLPREAVDVLEKLIQGRTSEVVDRALADLLDPGNGNHENGSG
ncbi:MAG TPA: hypothetical protein VFL95_09115 [Gemmatimonadales bacterium]|nr:hypothetical protein [Gemmatimonadales bacterium]